MRLNPLQLHLLKRYWKYHSEAYHSSDLILVHTKTWFICSLGAVGAYWLTKVDGFESLGWFWIGYLAAAMVVTIKSIRAFSKLWPVIDEIVNWERVNALLEAHSPQLPTAPKDQA